MERDFLTAPSDENEYDNPDGKYSMEFSSQTIRAGFIRKVFFLVTIMFGIVAGFCVIPMVEPRFNHWIRTHSWILFTSVGTFFVTSLIISCCSGVRKVFPLNLIILTVFTASAGVMTMIITSFYNVQSVLITLCITTVCSGSVTIYSVATKNDLTSKMGIAFILGMVLFSFGIIGSLFTIFLKWPIIHSIYSGAAALVTMFYLAIDVQMLMGGKKYELSPEDYIYAAMALFMDILNIFLSLLSIFGQARD